MAVASSRQAHRTVRLVLAADALFEVAVGATLLLFRDDAASWFGIPEAAIADSAAVVRAHLPRVALLVLAIVAVDLAITFVFQLQYVPTITKKATAAQLAPIRMMVRHSAIAMVALAPLVACALAAAYSHAKRR